MVLRRELWDVELTGWRRRARVTILSAVMVLAGVCAIAFALEQHREVREDTWHSVASESFLIPVLVPLLVLVLAWLARRRLGWGFGTAVLGLTTSAALLGFWGFVHWFYAVERSAATNVAIATLPLVFVACGGLFVAELLLPALERRRLERDVDPVFPTAKVVR